MSQTNVSNPLPIGQCATLACIWEATAAKPGNVYRGADFEDLTYVDFLNSAAVIGPILENTPQERVGRVVRDAVQATQQAVGTNTNLGILLLIAPLAAQGLGDEQIELERVLDSLTSDDTENVYEAIRLANPGGLGEVNSADVNEKDVPKITLVEAMELAADRDLVARQYANGFSEVHWLADRIEEFYGGGDSLNDAIVRGFLELLGREPDSLIARKCGVEFARKVSARGAAVLKYHGQRSNEYQGALADLDFYLRSDGHRLNPGTSADMVAAALFVLLRDGRLRLPVRYY
ncbi:MAG: triphosphoribosyl-dephospho-CoA synthase [Lacipirellulaceae bacterium]